MTDIAPGELVECLRHFSPCANERVPKKGMIYTVKEVIKGRRPDNWKWDVGLVLWEVDCLKAGYLAEAFRPLRHNLEDTEIEKEEVV